jgi:ABC-type Fe3+/spermidine/putrescine transport system ATPase subunit
MELYKSVDRPANLFVAQFIGRGVAVDEHQAAVHRRQGQAASVRRRRKHLPPLKEHDLNEKAPAFRSGLLAGRGGERPGEGQSGREDRWG